MTPARPEPCRVAGLARPRAAWFADVGAWSGSARVPISFVRCVSAAELRRRVAAGGIDAVMVDPGVAGVDDSLWQVAERAGTLVVIVAPIDEQGPDAPAATAGPDAGGAEAARRHHVPTGARRLDPTFTEDELMALLRQHTGDRHDAAGDRSRHSTHAPAPESVPASVPASASGSGSRPARRSRPGPRTASPPAEDEEEDEEVEVAAGAGPLAGHATSDRAPLVAVVGPGGCGVSTIAIAAAQGLAARSAVDASGGGATLGVVLADLVIPGSLAMYHDAGDVVPGLPELVDACRAGAVRPARRVVYEVDRRGYAVLLGCRSPRDRLQVDAAAAATALDRLRDEAAAVVTDTEPTIVGDDAAAGSAVWDRLAVGRAVARAADLVLLCTTTELRAVHEMLRLEQALVDAGVPTTRLVRVVNRASRRRGAAARTAGDLATLSGRTAIASVAVPDHPSVEGCHITGDPMPKAVVRPVARAVTAALGRR